MSRRADAKLLSLVSTVMSFLLIAGCGGGGGGGGGGTPPQPAPTITLSAPAGTANRTIDLSASVTAPAGVTRVEFLVDGTVVGTSVVGTSTASPYTFAWDTSTAADGAHSVTARVTDAANNVVTSAATTVTVNNHPSINVALSPDETFPRPTSTASGSGDITFNLIDGTVSGGVTVSGITATLAHIHLGYAGSTGPVVVNFVQNATDPNLWEPQSGGILTAEQIDALLAGKLYVNVHSSAYPQGEIRGQIRPENITVVLATLSGDDVVPPVSIAASGIAAVTYDTLAGTATVHSTTAGVDDATDVHVHKAAADANNATALLTLAQDTASAGHWLAEDQAISATDREDLASNGWYLDVHTPGNPAGAIRGQFIEDQTLPPPSATLSQLQSSIFTPRCAGCHSGSGGSLPGAMNLTSAVDSYAALVNVPSIQQPAVLRVAPGNPDASYLVHKLEGAAGINGSRMPLGGPFLDQATIDQVRSWITAGAANN